jgi:hypothetical protein
MTAVEQVAKIYMDVIAKEKPSKFYFQVLYDTKHNDGPPPFKWDQRRKNEFSIKFLRAETATAYEWLVTTLRAGYMPSWSRTRGRSSYPYQVTDALEAMGFAMVGSTTARLLQYQ